jgi:hypothetical protein
MTPAEEYASWREDWVAEDASIVEQLPAARARLQVSEEQYQQEKERVAALERFASSCRGSFDAGAVVTLARPLYARLSEARESLKPIDAECGAARAEVQRLEARHADLQESIVQVDRALSAEKITTLRSPAETSRRKPPLIAFDDIEMRV